jgi:hypothetical protein
MRRTAGYAAALAALAVLAVPAGVAQAEKSAQETIDELQQQGYTVQIDKIGTAPLSKCVVTSVRNPQTLTQWVPYVGPGLGERGTFLIPVVTSQTISVSLDCSGR